MDAPCSTQHFSMALSHQVEPGSDLLCFQEAPLEAIAERFHMVS